MISKDNFVDLILPMAVKTQRQTGLPAAIMVAQSALETGYGEYIIKDTKTGDNSHNLFNIKGEGPAGSVVITSLEFDGEQLIKVDSHFRKYHSYEESFNDYASYIFRNSRYEPAVAVANDPERYAKQLQACGYATDPKYAEKIINIAQENNLFEKVTEMVKKQEEDQFIEMETPADWAKKSVEKAQEAGVMVGYGEGVWRPKAPVTREMLAVILDRLGLLDI